ncbi:hypothetical protein ACRAWD_06395 [Caulobacter segnis]
MDLLLLGPQLPARRHIGPKQAWPSWKQRSATLNLTCRSSWSTGHSGMAIAIQAMRLGAFRISWPSRGTTSASSAR